MLTTAKQLNSVFTKVTNLKAQIYSVIDTAKGKIPVKSKDDAINMSMDTAVKALKGFIESQLQGRSLYFEIFWWMATLVFAQQAPFESRRRRLC